MTMLLPAEEKALRARLIQATGHDHLATHRCIVPCPNFEPKETLTEPQVIAAMTDARDIVPCRRCGATTGQECVFLPHRQRGHTHFSRKIDAVEFRRRATDARDHDNEVAAAYDAGLTDHRAHDCCTGRDAAACAHAWDKAHGADDRCLLWPCPWHEHDERILATRSGDDG